MQSIKFKSDKTIKIGGDIYKPYTVGNLPPSFGFKYGLNSHGEMTEGISEWFNYKGRNDYERAMRILYAYEKTASCGA
jgi:hypothetical protein